jgi:monoamine oxidase
LPDQYTRFADYRWIESDDPTERVEVSVGNLIFAGEHTSDEYYGFMNGGAQTGRLAAEAVLRRLNA